MTPDFDFNHDGKVDMQDVHLYEDIFREERGNNKSSHGSSTGGHMSGRAVIGVFLSAAYLGAFLQGSVGVNLFTFLLGIVSLIVLIACLLSGK